MNEISANDNKPAIGCHDDTARALCSDRALRMLDALPALLRLDPLDELERDALEAAENLGRAVEAIHAYEPEADDTSDMAAALVRREYLARQCLAAYQAEIAIRQREAGAGVH